MPLKILAPDIKWVPESNYHLTLNFLGSIAKDDLQAVNEHLRALAVRSSFSLSVGGWGMFPNIKQPSVLWIGMGGELEALQCLWKQLDDRMSESGYPRDRRFHPHITLGRFRSPGNASSLIARLQQQSELNNIGSFTVTSLCLMESRLSPAGPSYRALSTHEFQK